MAGTTRTIAKTTLYNAIRGFGVQLLTIVTGIFVAPVAICALIASTVFLLPINAVGLPTLYLGIYVLLLLSLRVLGRRELQLLCTIVVSK